VWVHIANPFGAGFQDMSENTVKPYPASSNNNEPMNLNNVLPNANSTWVTVWQTAVTGLTWVTGAFPMQPSGLGRPWALKRTPGKLIMSNIIFFMDGEVRNYKGEL